ncbi:MAG TPA: DapH/DapD/GlmU-related protein [Opitutus sp.]|nr:DapH/DapD/GlmU-related protein [Opitutus sp.]
MSLLSHLRPEVKATLRARWHRLRHPHARLGTGCYVQRGARIARGSVVHDHCAILRGAELLRGVTLGEHVVIGARSRVGRSQLGRHCTLEPSVELYESTLGDYVRIQRGASCTDTHIGRFTYVARRAFLNLVTVGSFSSIGPEVLAGLGEHPTGFGSTSPVFYSTRGQCGRGFAPTDCFAERRPIIVGNDVWIGARAFIRDGVSIGDGAIIAGGSVVTHDVPPYAIVGGTPAKLIRSRFPETIVARLLAVAWWTWPEERLATAQPLLASREIETFLEWAEAGVPAGLHVSAGATG